MPCGRCLNNQMKRELIDGKIGVLADNLSKLTVQLEQSAPSNFALERVAAGRKNCSRFWAIWKERFDAESRMRLRS